MISFDPYYKLALDDTVLNWLKVDQFALDFPCKHL